MLPRGRASITSVGTPAGFALPSEHLLGNDNPAWTGSSSGPRAKPGPHAHGQPIGGQLGTYDGQSGADPARPKRSPFRRFIAPVVEGASGIGAGPALGGGLPAGAGQPLGYAWGQTNEAPDNISSNSYAARLGRPGGDPLPTGRSSDWRGGIQGYNDQLQVRDRHAYWSKGKASGPGNLYQGSNMSGRNPQLDGPPMAVLETVNISVNPQIGSPNTAFQDDLTRPYTWLGQQDGTRAPIYGGVPGLWQSYGNRGFTRGIHDPTNGEGGPAMVSSGPPHGLHSETIPDGKQLQDRYKATPQMRPVRLDRPSNSTTAGQSYSQTVQFQGDTGPAQASRGSSHIGLSFGIGNGWRGGGSGS